MLYRRFSVHSNSDALFKLSLVRPHLEYASAVWSPYKAGEVQAIESVQKFALKICRKVWDQSYETLTDLFRVPSLEERRLYLDLCTTFKIVHNLCYFPSDIICQHHATRLQELHQTIWNTCISPIQVSTLINFKAHSLAALLKHGTRYPWTCSHVHYHHSS